MEYLKYLKDQFRIKTYKYKDGYGNIHTEYIPQKKFKILWIFPVWEYIGIYGFNGFQVITFNSKLDAQKFLDEEINKTLKNIKIYIK